jgi:AraC-like DNA-binding protein
MQLETLASTLIPNHSARIMRQMMTEIGIDWVELAERVKLDPAVFDDPTRELTGIDELKLQRGFARATRREPGTWFHTGRRYHVLSLGPLGLAVLTARNTEHGLRTAMLFQDLCSSMLRYELIYDRGELRGIAGDASGIPADLREFHLERALSCVPRFLSDMWQDSQMVVRAEISLDRPKNWQRCEEILGFPVVFGAPDNRWYFREGAGSAPLPMANPLLEETYRGVCLDFLDRIRIRNDFVAELSAVLARVGHRFPSATDAASTLGVSERTLHRRLAEAGKNFGQIVDGLREERARYLLRHSSLSLAQLAELLGFAEAASFSRAFKRWTGLSPRIFRTSAVPIDGE